MNDICKTCVRKCHGITNGYAYAFFGKSSLNEKEKAPDTSGTFVGVTGFEPVTSTLSR